MPVFISDYSSLLTREYQTPNEEDVLYIQNFADTDLIRMQIKTDISISLFVKDLSTNIDSEITPVVFPLDQQYNINDYSFTKPIGCYELKIANSGGVVLFSKWFNVVGDECLKNTVKIRYSHSRNEHDTVFINPQTKENLYFDIRFKGGFLYRENEYKTEDESFRDQNYAAHLMSSFSYFSKTLTIGDSNGVPDWAGWKLASIFSRTDVRVDSVSVKKSEGAEIEKIDIGEYYPMRIFKIPIELDNLHEQAIEIPTITIYTSDKGEIYTSDKGEIYIQDRIL
ncbi:hypothetical protein D0T49_04310 [Paludibacter sp. 221]|uniref:hypothetical protein n=1 Tax=Paludibacter sp. 221 TaxID=2302939 RepID=UPI0013D4A20B|nr:hypothetical protein [Paludibacter sp. 221]NDV46263.1 hypothetical protein [Paludibacter sp. 221]